MPMLNRFTAAAAALFAAGLVLVALSVLRGEGSAGIAICVPFFYGTGPLASLGVLCFFIGAVLLFLGIARGAAEAGWTGGEDGVPGPGGAGEEDEGPGPGWTEGPAGREGPMPHRTGGAAPRDAPGRAPPAPSRPAAPRARAGGVVLIGPIPVVFGSDPGISRAMFYLALGLMAAFIVVLLALALL